ncbi:GDSL-type esterase/lipase family protein [Uruburuella suis]|jgi:acyl-CoA thioesterase-1|uniref:GDSL-type esterase/lipase family protein n=1 Tax=Uruburuella suis TaxID=252130 RepID=UPI003F4ACBC3
MNTHFITRRRFMQISALLAAALTACSKTAPHAALPAGSTILALGDSLTAGYAADAEAAYPAVLASLTGWQIINGGVSGNTSAQALARLPALMRRQPQLVLVSIGGNDFLRKVPEADTRSNIRQIVQQIKAAGVPAVLVAVPYFTTGALFGRLSEHPMYEELAAELNVPLFKGAWAEVLGNKKLKSDQIHANAQGYRVFAEKMWAFLKQQGFAR